MNGKNKAILQLTGMFIVLAILTYVVVAGVGQGRKGSADNIKLGLDLAGGVSITYETEEANPSDTEVKDTVYKIQKRVENYSTEAVVYREGTNRINVDIPGVSDANKILEELGQPGSLSFVDEEENIVLEGSDVKTATAQSHQNTMGAIEYVVQLTLTTEGASKFAKATSDNVGKVIYIIYDDEIISYPTVNEAITGGEAVISGMSSFDDANKLASSIRIGSLPLKLRELRSNVVGAKLGEEALNTSLKAGLVGIIIILLFMIAVYLIPGLASSIALVFYVLLVLLILNVFNVTLTLPGVAGIILSIGMAVDANVIIFARIKEELAMGKTVRSSIKGGFDKALSAIIDGNVTTLIAAVVLYLRGSGTVKGFAQTLAIGIILSMFTALTVTRFILKQLYELGLDDVKFYKAQKPIKQIKFVENIKKFYVFSAILIIIGFVAMGINIRSIGGMFNYDLDFRGGTVTEVVFGSDVNIDDIKGQVRDIVEEETALTTIEISEISGANTLNIKTTELNLEQRAAISARLVDEFGVDESLITAESISATISGEMRNDAIIAIIIATVCMLIYIWFRFKDANFGASAVLALVHDVLVVVMVYALIRIPVGGTFIACTLTIVGYSINATIVVFDRIRENKALRTKKESMAEVVNLSINQTLIRNINTSLTTFIMLLVLVIFGVQSVKEFAGPLMAGVICGAYSSVCIAGTLWFSLKKGFNKDFS